MINDVSNADFWQKRYENGAIGWDIGNVSQPLKEYIDQLTDKGLKILIPGCGSGYEAKYLIEKGFKNIHVLDFAPAPLEKLEASNDSNCLTTHCEDIFTHAGKYDLILEQTLFCAIDPKRRKEYIEQIASLLVSKGKFVGVLFDREFDGGPPFGGSKQEYLRLMMPFFSEISMESCYNSIEPRIGSEVFFIARKA